MNLGVNPRRYKNQKGVRDVKRSIGKLVGGGLAVFLLLFGVALAADQITIRFWGGMDRTRQIWNGENREQLHGGEPRYQGGILYRSMD